MGFRSAVVPESCSADVGNLEARMQRKQYQTDII